MSRTLRIGTRASKLALVQTRWVMARLEEANPGAGFEIVEVRTEGDRSADANKPFGVGVGVFVREMKRALLADEVDIAVHSMKDVPTELASETVISGIPKRVDPRDVIITRDGSKLEDLPAGALVGTSSARRISQLLRARPDLQTIPIRGNVDTRLRKLEEGVDGISAIMLAAAGLGRLGMEDVATQLLPLDDFCPPAGQGILAIQTRSNDSEAVDVVGKLDDAATRSSCEAERAFISALGAGCKTPLGAFAVTETGTVTLTASVYSMDGKEVIAGRESGDAGQAIETGTRLARQLAAEGAQRLVEASREAAS